MAWSLANINTSLYNTLKDTTGLSVCKNYNEIPEGILDVPQMQIYWDGLTFEETRTDRNTFGSATQVPVRQFDLQFFVDIFVSQRSHIAENWDKIITLADNTATILTAEDASPFFGDETIKAFTWRAEHFNFIYSTKLYPGVRFTLNVRAF